MREAQSCDQFAALPFWEATEKLWPSRISPRRRDGMRVLFQLMQERDARSIIETGTLRRENNWAGDGGMTWHFAQYCKRTGARLLTIDNSRKALDVAKKVLGDVERVTFCESDSVIALQRFDMPIDVLYLDSLDYDLDPRQSQAHVMDEVFAARPHLHEKSIIAIDDCGFPDGGKGGLGVPYLSASGWTVAHPGYLTVLVR